MITSKNLLEKMLEDNNHSVLISDHPINEAELFNYVKNSSTFTILPTLLCFHHGIELLLKGFVFIKLQMKTSHDKNLLLNEFRDYYPAESDLSSLLSNYIERVPPFLNDFYTDNGIDSIKTLYNALRYPDETLNRQGNSKSDSTPLPINYYSLTHPNNDIFLPQMHDFSQDIDKIMKYSVSLYYKISNHPGLEV